MGRIADMLKRNEERDRAKFQEVLNHIKENESDLIITNIGSCYFTVQNKEGYRADFELGSFEISLKSYEDSTFQDRFITTGKNAPIEEIVESLYKTLEDSKRQTNENRAYSHSKKCNCRCHD